MRKADLLKNHYVFEGAILKYITLLNRILPARRVVKTNNDKREIAESALLKLCSHWEAFVVEEIVDCVNLDSSQLAAHLELDLPRHLSRDLCEAILMRDGYLDFRSMGDLKGTARKTLATSTNPFAQLDSAVCKSIDEVYRMRNYLSHRSRASSRSLMSMYQSNYGMTNWVEPGRFLLAYNNKRLLDYFNSFYDASKQMASIV